jgi:HK97 family phage portal protein
MNLFGYKSRRPAARPALSRPFQWGGTTIGDFGNSTPGVPASYDERVRLAFVTNPVAHRACRLVSQAVADCPLLSDNPVAARLVKTRSGGQNLMENCAVQILLHGNAYIQILADGEDKPGELYALRPERLAVEADGAGYPIAFTYRAGSQALRLPVEDAQGRTILVHVKAVHPLDDHYGLGGLSAAMPAVAVHNAAARWNRALLDNAARPSGALVFDPKDGGGPMSATQFERLRSEMETQFQGAGNAGRPMLLEGGLKWQSISLSPADMDFIALKDSAARDIAMAFGVPPMLIGIPGDATYANYREANRALWRQTVLPLASTILSSIEQGLQSWGVDGRLSVDVDTVPALSDDREKLWQRVSEADFLSPAEKRTMLGIDALFPAAE